MEEQNLETKFIRKRMIELDGKNLPIWLVEDLLESSILYKKNKRSFRVRPKIRIGYDYQVNNIPPLQEYY